MTDVAPPSGLPSPPGTVARLVRTQLAWIVAVTALATLGAVTLSLLQTPVYQSTARVVVLPEVRSAGPAPQPPSMGTEKELAASPVVAAPAARNLGIPVADLLSGVQVTVPVDTQVLKITYSSSSRSEARLRAEALASAYVAYKDSQPIRTLPERARIISAATLPTAPSRPNIPLNVAAGLLAGLVLGFLTALLRDRLDDRVRGAGDLEQRGLPVLAVLPPGREPAPYLVVMRAPQSPLARAYGALGEQVLVGMPPTSAAVVVVAGVARSDSTSSVSTNLAVTLALSGSEVVVVDADTRALPPDSPQQDSRPGLLDVLSHHQASVAAVLQQTRVPRLRLLPIGHRSPGSTAQLIGSRWAEVAAMLAGSVDAVVVSAAPILSSADTVRLARGADGVLVVVHDRHTTRSELDHMATELGRLEARILGCVLVERERTWLRVLARRQRTAASRRTEHPDDYAKELSATPPGPEAAPTPQPNGQAQLDPESLREASQT